MRETTIHCLIGILLAIWVPLGCHSPDSDSKEKPVSLHASVKTNQPRVTGRKANALGDVLILEYHNFKPGKGGMFRTPSGFRKDLERLYRMGFRPVTVSEYLADKMPLPPGASPVVITFDDSTPTQYRFKSGHLDPDCAVGIWESFSKSHPDFPLRATFYVLPNLWGEPSLVDEKVAALRKRGSELGCHTMTHRALSSLSSATVKKEFDDSIAMLARLGQPLPVSMALPLGITPKDRSLEKVFTGVMLVGANPAPSPRSSKFDRFRVPRIQAYDGPSGSTFWLDQVEAGKVSLYVAP
jgi:peptidoglycan/xylan/chitin deacetylase (PgdA/CDA1 family)